MFSKPLHVLNSCESYGGCGCSNQFQEAIGYALHTTAMSSRWKVIRKRPERITKFQQVARPLLSVALNIFILSVLPPRQHMAMNNEA